MNRKSTLVFLALFGGALLASGAYAGDYTTAALGTAAPGNAGRTVKIGASTKYINAEYSEVLTIQNQQGRSFTWRFDTLHASTGFPLTRIAPPHLDAGDTWVYVHPRNGGIGD